ncbi:hypothetical protein ACWDWO_22325 [Actinopolymorpha singaporensis]|uniref:hypothetical protein n=1 Tax=Actinopolymorpha singaporensis TaxID=117157 RepID=UPI0012FE5672|nr:hypothetical protein [Actinopolymorpha singaporensis]
MNRGVRRAGVGAFGLPDVGALVPLVVVFFAAVFFAAAFRAVVFFAVAFRPVVFFAAVFRVARALGAVPAVVGAAVTVLTSVAYGFCTP